MSAGRDGSHQEPVRAASGRLFVRPPSSGETHRAGRARAAELMRGAPPPASGRLPEFSPCARAGAVADRHSDVALATVGGRMGGRAVPSGPVV